MKITDVGSYALSAPLGEAFFFSQPGAVHRRSTMLVEVLTDEGVSGFGEALCNGLQPPDIAKATVNSVLREMYLGQDPFVVGVRYTSSSEVVTARSPCPSAIVTAPVVIRALDPQRSRRRPAGICITRYTPTWRNTKEARRSGRRRTGGLQRCRTHRTSSAASPRPWLPRVRRSRRPTLGSSGRQDDHQARLVERDRHVTPPGAEDGGPDAASTPAL
jgi:hypothetical protein